MKSAVITGVTGQDGSYLAELLLGKGYTVFGGIRRNSDFTTKRIDHIFGHERFYSFNFDLNDCGSVSKLLDEHRPSYFFNLAAMSHVGTSFDLPTYSATADGVAVVALIDILKKHSPKTVFYQASTSELFGGGTRDDVQDLGTPFDPKSPYASAKLLAYYATLNAHRSGDLKTVNGILFNHESPRRGRTFVTKKISWYAARHKLAPGTKPLELGNLESHRDWGWAPDYVRAIYKSVAEFEAPIYVCGTGKMVSVRDFARAAFACIDVDLAFEGVGLNEIGFDEQTGEKLVVVNPAYYRPLEVNNLRAGSAGNVLDESTSFSELVERMVRYDLKYSDYGGHEYDDKHSDFWPLY